MVLSDVHYHFWQYILIFNKFQRQIAGDMQNLVMPKQVKSILQNIQWCNSIFYHFNLEKGETLLITVSEIDLTKLVIHFYCI